MAYSNIHSLLYFTFIPECGFPTLKKQSTTHSTTGMLEDNDPSTSVRTPTPSVTDDDTIKNEDPPSEVSQLRRPSLKINLQSLESMPVLLSPRTDAVTSEHGYFDVKGSKGSGEKLSQMDYNADSRTRIARGRPRGRSQSRPQPPTIQGKHSSSGSTRNFRQGHSGSSFSNQRNKMSILKNNLDMTHSQSQYQQQEKVYLNGITRYQNKYHRDDDYYYDRLISSDEEADEQTEGETEQEDEYEEESGSGHELVLPGSGVSAQKQALRALGKQVGIADSFYEQRSEYSLDPDALLDLMDHNRDIQFHNTEDNDKVVERLQWQAILDSVLTGDVVTGEKTKMLKPMSESENYLRASYKEELWPGIRAKLFGRTEEEQKRLVMYHRELVDDVLNDIMSFKLNLPSEIEDKSYAEKVKYAKEKVDGILQRYDQCQELWRTSTEMETDKPLCAKVEFVSRINALTAWSSVSAAIDWEASVLRMWVGNDELDVLKPNIVEEPVEAKNIEGVDPTETQNPAILKDERSFVERMMKEKDTEEVFSKRLFQGLNHWILKAKESYLAYHKYFDLLGLPSYLDDLFRLAGFPSKLMKEFIKMRLAYARKVRNPTLMMIDQTLEGLKVYLKLALEIRISFIEYCAPEEGWISQLDYQDKEFDDAILKCVAYYVQLLNRKLLDSPKTSSSKVKTFRTFREPEVLENEWRFLRNVGCYIDGGAAEIAKQFATLTTRIATRLNHYVQSQLQGPPYDEKGIDNQKMIRWYMSAMENYGQLRRRLIRFSGILSASYQNCLQIDLIDYRTKKFLALLQESNHALYYSKALAEQGVYIFASESLADRPYEVERILKASHLGADISSIPERHLAVVDNYNYYSHTYAAPLTATTSSLSSESAKGHDYVLVITPANAMLWDGIVVPFEKSHLPFTRPKVGQATMLIKGEDGEKGDLNRCGEWFRKCVGDTVGRVLRKGCSIDSVDRELRTTNLQFFRMTTATIDAAPRIRSQCRAVNDCQELAHNFFIYVRDLGRDAARNLNQQRRTAVVLRLINMSIEWLSFIVDDCVPTDPKTFRWCVTALEFAMDVTRGFNILTLNSEDFYRLKTKVAACMSLLISHFDIMGARTKELQRERMLHYQAVPGKDMFTLDDASLRSLRKHMMGQIAQIEEHRRELQVEQQSVGRVLDATDSENQFLTYLASSFSSLSIRWQKGKYLGGGTFGSVYESVNLDTGGPMAVKEIKFQNRQTIKKIVPAVKNEMTVLQMLSHPNIVQFFGVEVHRDRVYIFMEYCNGGSLAGLLEYGRIEDEAIIQLYTLQMLEGLAYLHKYGVIHGDIKPENILLDHMGVIKFIDFGSSKIIPMNGSAGSSPNPNEEGSGEFTKRSPPSQTSPQMSIDLIVKRTKTMTGTPMYMSPEAIKGSDTSKIGAIDIWALGCCVLEMATGRRPWANLDNEFAVMYHIAAGDIPQFPEANELSQQGQECLAKCLITDPDKRYTAADLLQDPWIQAIRKEAFGDSTDTSSETLDTPTN